MEYEYISEDVIHFPYAVEDPKAFVDFFEATVSYSVPEWTNWMSGGGDHDDIDQYGLLKLIELQDIKAEEDEELRNNILKYHGMHEKATIDSFLKYIELIGTSKENLEKISEQTLAKRPLHTFTLKKYIPNKAMGPHPDAGDLGNFTVAIYLSTEMEGGRLHFTDLDEYVNITPGSAVVYPSIFLHGSEEIFSGTKYLTNEVIQVDVNLLDGRNAYA